MKLCQIYELDYGSCLVIDKNKTGLFDDENPRLVFSFYATSYNDACQQYNDYYNFGDYKEFDIEGDDPW